MKKYCDCVIPWIELVDNGVYRCSKCNEEVNTTNYDRDITDDEALQIDQFEQEKALNI